MLFVGHSPLYLSARGVGTRAGALRLGLRAAERASHQPLGFAAMSDAQKSTNRNTVAQSATTATNAESNARSFRSSIRERSHLRMSEC
jgi:hypothetical protein